MSNDELIALVISLRPKGIEAAAIPYFVELIKNAVILDLTREEEKK